MKFEVPELNVVKFDMVDVITVSGGSTFVCPNEVTCDTETAEWD